MNRPYCTGRGSLKPRRWRNSLRSLAWISMGRKRSTGSPPSRARKKTAVRERKTTRRVWPRRETRDARKSAGEELEVEGGGVEGAVCALRVARDGAGEPPAERAIEN